MKARIRSFLDGLPLRLKFLVIYSINLTIGAVLIGGIVVEKSRNIASANQELRGLAPLAVLRDAYERLDAHRFRDGDSPPATSRLSDLSNALRGSPVLVENGYAPRFANAVLEAGLTTSIPASARIAAGSKAETVLREAAIFVSNEFKIILDPELDSYYSGVLAVRVMPAVIRTLRQIGEQRETGFISSSDTAYFSGMTSQVISEIEQVIATITAARRAPPAFETKAALLNLTGAATALADDFSLTDPDDIERLRDTAMGTAFELWSWSLRDLEERLRANRGRAWASLIEAAGAIAILVILGYALIVYLSRRITEPVRELTRVAGAIAAGTPDTVRWHSTDEFGTLATAFNGMVRILVKQGTEQAQLLSLVKAAEAQSAILDAIVLPVLIVDMETGSCHHANSAAQVLFPDFSDAHDGVFWFLDARCKAMAERTLAETGSLEQVEVECVAGKGVRRPAQISANIFDYKSRRTLLVSLTPLDELVRERTTARRLDEILRESLSNSRYSLTLYSAEERVLYQTTRRFVWRKSEAADDGRDWVGATFRDIMAAIAEIGAVEDRARSTIRDGKTFSQYAPLATKIGTWERFLPDGSYVQTHVRRISDGNYLILSEDLTEIVKGREALATKERLTSLATMVAGVAHEVNTPLGVAITSATLLQDNAREAARAFNAQTLTASQFASFMDDVAEILNLMVRNLERAETLVRSFKQVAGDQISDDRRTIAVKSYIADVVNSLSPVIRKTPHRVDVTGEEADVTSYPGAIAQVVTNLISNALLHAFGERPEGGTVTIAVAGREKTVEVTVSDDGCGMSPEALKNVFEPFYTTKRGKGGTGLGMTIVYNLITQQLSGTIDVRSAPGAGTTVRIALPR